MPQFFTFEEFRDKIIKPDYDKGLIDYEGDVSLDEIAESCLILFQHQGMLLKEQHGENIVYVRTSESLPIKKEKK